MNKYVLTFFIITVLSLGILWSKEKFLDKEPLLIYKDSQTVFLGKSEINGEEKIVKILPNQFEPREIVIKRGEKIVWINDVEIEVWPASDPHPSHLNYNGFDPKRPLPPGKAWGFTFNKVGQWFYHDHLDPDKRGVVRVVE